MVSGPKFANYSYLKENPLWHTFNSGLTIASTFNPEIDFQTHITVTNNLNLTLTNLNLTLTPILAQTLTPKLTLASTLISTQTLTLTLTVSLNLIITPIQTQT